MSNFFQLILHYLIITVTVAVTILTAPFHSSKLTVAPVSPVVTHIEQRTKPASPAASKVLGTESVVENKQKEGGTKPTAPQGEVVTPTPTPLIPSPSTVTQPQPTPMPTAPVPIQTPSAPVSNYHPDDLVQQFLIDQASRDAENKKAFDETVKRQEECAAQRDAALAPIQVQQDSVKQQQAQLEADVSNMTGLSDAGKNRILAAEGLPLVQKLIDLGNKWYQIYSQYGGCL